MSTAELLPRGYSATEQWSQAADALYRDFPSGGAEGILPPHFVRATFPKIGGQIVQLDSGFSRFWGLLLPGYRNTNQDWTLRCHWINANSVDKAEIETKLSAELSEQHIDHVCWYDATEKRQEKFGGEILQWTDKIALASPNLRQAKEAQELQQRAWNVTDQAFLYPYDLYRPDSGVASRLVALSHEQVIGFLFGFYGKGKQWFGTAKGYAEGVWVESQLMAVDTDYRRAGIAKRLKFLQRQQALAEGIRVIHWTVDPLQSGNAVLNFNHLGGAAVQFYPDYYVFRNELNQVSASRIGISWILDSDRVRGCEQENPLRFDYRELSSDSSTEIIIPMESGLGDWTPQGETLLIEIPQNWNEVQATDVHLAQLWRSTTDAVLERILGVQAGRFALVGITREPTDGRPFLVASRVNK